MDRYQVGREIAFSDLHALVEDDRKSVVPEGTSWTDVRKYRDYSRGRQKGTLNADQLRVMAAILQNKFADNVLRMILRTHANRLRIARFDVDDDAVGNFIYMTWVKNQLPDLFADAVFAILRDGNHAISLNWLPTDDPDDEYGGYVVLNHERWWDGRDGMFVMYDEDGNPDYAVKEWKPVGRGAVKRRNIYFSDMLFRFRMGTEGWEIFNYDSDALVADMATTGPEGIARGPVAWTKRNGDPIGIPVVHFPNGSDDDTYYGASLLAGGPLAFQDQINAIQHDISAAAMLNGSPRTYSKGFALPADPQNPGVKKKVNTGPGVHHHSDEQTAEWGTIPPGSLAELRSGYMLKLEALCRVTDTPLHSITGQWPSGEAIFRADMPLEQDTRNLAESVGPGASSLMHRSTEIQNAFGRMTLDEDKLITTIFEPVEQRDALALWSVAEKAAPFVSEEEVLRLVGYSPSEIKVIMQERKKASERKIETAQAVFNRGADLALEDEEEDEGIVA